MNRTKQNWHVTITPFKAVERDPETGENPLRSDADIPGKRFRRLLAADYFTTEIEEILVDDMTPSNKCGRIARPSHQKRQNDQAL